MNQYKLLSYIFAGLAGLCFLAFAWGKKTETADSPKISKTAIVLCLLFILGGIICVIEYVNQNSGEITDKTIFSLIVAILAWLFGAYMMWKPYGSVLPSGYIIISILTIFQLAQN